MATIFTLSNLFVLPFWALMIFLPVSYTHLDVYKRQEWICPTVPFIGVPAGWRGACYEKETESPWSY